MIQIKHRYNGRVLFEVESESIKAALEIAVKQKIDLRYADLRYANLRYADLRYADLSYADLSYAKNAPLCLFGMHYQIYIDESGIRIGCEYHSITDWESFDDERIYAMDGDVATEFWSTHKEMIIDLAKYHAATVKKDD